MSVFIPICRHFATQQQKEVNYFLCPFFHPQIFSLAYYLRKTGKQVEK
jgi:hypothetical protein